MKCELLIATRNGHKTREIAQMLGAIWKVSDLTCRPEMPPVEETGKTFEENATLKACTISRFYDGLVLADDSGLEVDALRGAPGIRSARFAGDHADDEDNRRRLLLVLAGLATSPGGHTGRFRCAMALAMQGRQLATFEGTVEGRIIGEPRGEGGFGYDSLFVPAGELKTFAELPQETKNSMSHRARALVHVVDFLKEFRRE